jgi:hypothetical protein
MIVLGITQGRAIRPICHAFHIFDINEVGKHQLIPYNLLALSAFHMPKDLLREKLWEEKRLAEFQDIFVVASV